MNKIIVNITILLHVLGVSFGQEIRPQIWLHSKKLVLDGNDKSSSIQLDSRLLEKRKFLNFHKTISFSDSNGPINVPYTMDEHNKFTVFTVFTPLTKEMESGIWGIKNSTRDMLLTTARVGGPATIENYEDKYAQRPIIHTVTQFWPSVNENDLDTQEFWIGSTGQEIEGIKKFEGTVSELILFNKKLNDLQRNQVETYLSIKYGISLISTNYTSSDGEILWDFEKDEDFPVRITGVGRDDSFGLSQMQSTNADEPNLFTIGIGAIVISNEANKGFLENRNYLLWGDNSLPLSFEQDFNSKENDITLLSRKWKMKAFGSVINTETEVRVNTEQFVIPDSHELYLLINRKGSNEFTDLATLDKYKAVYNTELKSASFNGVKWDNDASGEDVFTLALLPKSTTVTQAFEVSPNPSRGAFQVNVSLQADKDIQLKILNAAGRVLKVMNGQNQKDYVFDLTLEQSGEYWVELKHDGWSQTKPIIISK